MIFKNPSLLTTLDIWTPRYSDQYKDGERVALLAKYKVDAGSPWIIVKFTKAKHLIGQRYCIKRSDAQQCKLDTNGKIPCYAVPMSKFEHYETVQEINGIIDELFPETI